MATRLTDRIIAVLAPRSVAYEVHDAALKGFLVRVQPTGRKTFYLSYRIPGSRQKRIKIGPCEVLGASEARNMAMQQRGKVSQGTDVQAQRQQLALDVQRERLKVLGRFIDETYAPWYELNMRSGVTPMKHLRKVFAHLLHKPMHEIEPLVIERWRAKRKQQGIREETINRDLTLLNGVFIRAVQWRILPFNPIATVKPYKVDRSRLIVRYLSVEEEHALRNALDQREETMRSERDSHNVWRTERNMELYPDLRCHAFTDHLKPMVLLSMNTGMRRGELFNLRWQDVNTFNQVLTVRGESAKSGNSRHIPLNEEAMEVLRLWRTQCSGNGLVFPGKDGKQPFNEVKTAWYGVLQRAGIENFRWHDLRHHFASSLVMRKVDLNAVRELLGHRDYNTTLRYAHLAPSHLSDAVATLNQRAGALHAVGLRAV